MSYIQDQAINFCSLINMYKCLRVTSIQWISSSIHVHTSFVITLYYKRKTKFTKSSFFCLFRKNLLSFSFWLSDNLTSEEKKIVLMISHGTAQGRDKMVVLVAVVVINSRQKYTYKSFYVILFHCYRYFCLIFIILRKSYRHC